jgi:hypothetical protein
MPEIVEHKFHDSCLLADSFMSGTNHVGVNGFSLFQKDTVNPYQSNS